VDAIAALLPGEHADGKGLKNKNKQDLMTKFVSTSASHALSPNLSAILAECQRALSVIASTEDMSVGDVDHFDYHGNFDSARFSKWFRHLCQVFYEDHGHEDAEGNRHGGHINMDGATYHKLLLNPVPVSGSNRPDVIAWLEKRGQEINKVLITPEQKLDSRRSTTGLTLPELFEIVQANKPDPIYEVYTIAKEWGHTVRFTPPYCHRSQPIEIIWANVKNPIGRAKAGQGAKSLPDLMEKLQRAKDNLKESMLLGAYADTRQWEDEMWLADQDLDGADGEMPNEPDTVNMSDDEDDANDAEDPGDD
jgi:hypothetical protein